VRIAEALGRFSSRFVPGSFAIAVLLTLGLALGWTEAGAPQVLDAWGDMATDLIQPIWALPLLAVARLDFKYMPLVTLAFFLWG
jgi:short subunit fatty acids transporter